MQLISVKERLPRYTEPSRVVRAGTFPLTVVDVHDPNQYLVYTTCGVFELAKFEKNGTWEFDNAEGETVTHYAELPAQPIGEGDPAPASAVEEAAKMYPNPNKLLETDTLESRIAEIKRQAHITCAGMYTGEIGKGREAIDILKALCALKKHKETVGKDEYYEKAQPEVWKMANRFIEKYNP